MVHCLDHALFYPGLQMEDLKSDTSTYIILVWKCKIQFPRVLYMDLEPTRPRGRPTDGKMRMEQ
jgi:hypothetical protein